MSSSDYNAFAIIDLSHVALTSELHVNLGDKMTLKVETASHFRYHNNDRSKTKQLTFVENFKILPSAPKQHVL